MEGNVTCPAKPDTTEDFFRDESGEGIKSAKPKLGGESGDAIRPTAAEQDANTVGVSRKGVTKEHEMVRKASPRNTRW